jgi:lysylphosphatidylglycerol synthetase-like protein (DUF2156 family)
MNLDGILIGVGAFLIIGLLHPVVIKGEYHFGKRIWSLFLVSGVASIVLSAFWGDLVVSALLAVLGFSLLWSIHELFQQERRVRKGWYPANPHREVICPERAEGEESSSSPRMGP